VSLIAGFLLVGTLAVVRHGAEVFDLTQTTLLWLALLGLINYPLGRLLYFTSVHLAGITRATPIVSTTPIVAISLGIIAGGETLSPMSAIGTLAIIGGIILIVSKKPA
jgi:drug/metabolite transporter (DMT)-like permease